MTYSHDKKVNNIAECNLLNDTINNPKRTKTLNNHRYPILHGCINTRKGKAKFKNFLNLLDSECIFTIVIGRLVEELPPRKDAMIQWNTQAGNIYTNIKVEVYFTLP